MAKTKQLTCILQKWHVGDSCVVCRYVVVTRPARQGRLKLALEEVLSMTVDTPLSRCAHLLTLYSLHSAHP